jgi:hypothetical protein
MSSLRLGWVKAVHAQDHSCDLVMCDDGTRHVGAQILSLNGSTNTGINDLPQPAAPASGDKWDVTARTSRDLRAVVAFVGRVPVVLGLLYPQVGQMTFADANRAIRRHASDVYETTDAAGNHEFFHPSGTYVRIGTSGAHEDLTGRDVDGGWKIANNTSAAVHYHITVANSAHGTAATLNISPTGQIDVTAAGAVNITATGTVTITAPTVHMTGNLSVDGNVTAGAGGASYVELLGHKHSGVLAGAAQTGAPVPGS